MSDENSLTLKPASGSISFGRKNDLSKMLKKLDAATPEALELLQTVVKDDKQDMKLRVQCAQAILDKRVQVSESIAKDQLARTVAESRQALALLTMGKGKPKLVEGDDEGNVEPVPKYMPDMIHDLSEVGMM